MRHTLRLLSLLFGVSTFTLQACAVQSPPDEVETSTDQLSASPAAVEVLASTRRTVVGTPTYGAEATEPLLSVELRVEDALLATAHPGFDGQERPFVLIPREEYGDVRWERIALHYRGQLSRGYFAERRLDVYDVSGVKLSEADLTLTRGLGVALGLETNVGTIWLQSTGDNFPVTEVR